MNPKKYKEILEITNSELDVDPKIIKKVVDYYWEDVRKNLSNLEHPHILVDGLGTFNIKWNILQVNIERYGQYLGNRENLVFSRYHVYKNTEDKLERMQKLEQLMKEHHEKKKEHYKRKNKNDME